MDQIAGPCHAAIERVSDMRMTERTCEICGRTFMGHPRTKRCPFCEPVHKRQMFRDYYENSIKKCAKCGKPLDSDSVSRYCRECWETNQNRPEMVTVICPLCGGTFERPLTDKRRKYCTKCRPSGKMEQQQKTMEEGHRENRGA